MAQVVLLPLSDTTDDHVMRLTCDEAKALHLLLSKLTVDEMVEKGLSQEQAYLVCDVIHACY
jgi:hypothetical protein